MTTVTIRKPPTNAGLKFPPQPMTQSEVRQLLAAASIRSNSGVRLRAMIGVLFGSGLRLAEMLALYPKDADTQGGYVHVASGKGGRARTVGLDPFGCSLLEAWVDRRASLGLTRRHLIFCTYSEGRIGKPLLPRDVRGALARLGKKAGLERRCNPHAFRHGTAWDLAMAGVPTHIVQSQLGHASLAVTDVYLKHLTPADLVGVMRNRSWGEDEC